ncbi:MAG: hypothetical protein GX628_00090 [Clostridiales bacterium]|nr:hypothetical protein [Clostridiales bacterium]
MINTVLGSISADSLGDVLFHEHVVCCDPSMRMAFGERWFRRDELIEKAVRLFSAAKTECGVATIIDGTPADLGRDIGIIREVSERSGVNVVASSGVYTSEAITFAGKTPERFARYFIEECEKGVDGTDVRPGILKCATGEQGFTDINVMMLTTMAIVQRETGLPLFAHNNHSAKTPFRQLEIFDAAGADLSKVVIGHASDSYDPDYLDDVLKSGCSLGFDRIYPGAYKRQAKTIAALIARGREDRIVLSHDFFAYVDFGDADWESRKNDGYGRSFTTIHKQLLPELRELGVAEKQISKLVRKNPARLLSI